MKKVLITGITGQDGSYLAELLLSKDYEVHGLVRRVAFENPNERFSRINHLIKDKKIQLHYGDVVNYPTVWRIIGQLRPDEVYHLAAQSQVKISFEDEFGAFATNTYSAHYLLSAIKELKPDCKFYFAATSEMFGKTLNSPQDEKTPFNPVSPYGISKMAGFYLTKMFRKAYGIFACSGILANHESPRRGFEFVTRKITSTAAKIKFGLEKELRIGNLNSKRDWGFAGDYVKAMWLMLQQDKPDDYVIGVGENHTVREFVEKAFLYAGMELKWEGEGVNERGIDKNSGKTLVVVDEEFFRPTDVNVLLINPAKARKVLGWTSDVTFDELVKMMVEADIAVLSK